MRARAAGRAAVRRAARVLVRHSASRPEGRAGRLRAGMPGRGWAAQDHEKTRTRESTARSSGDAGAGLGRGARARRVRDRRRTAYAKARSARGAGRYAEGTRRRRASRHGLLEPAGAWPGLAIGAGCLVRCPAARRRQGQPAAYSRTSRCPRPAAWLAAAARPHPRASWAAAPVTHGAYRARNRVRGARAPCAAPAMLVAPARFAATAGGQRVA